ncbi:MAG: lysophospholipid acyltransferase family protein [Rhizobiaceae bacterium]
MIASLRMAWGFVLVALTTITLVPLQVIGMKTGWFSASVLPMHFHRMALKALGVRVRVVGELSSQRPLMIVCNHVSWSDILVLGSLGRFSFVARADMATWPVVGYFSRLQRSVFVERDSRGKSGAQTQELAARLNGKEVIVLFPEGTTGDGNFLLPFKSTLFGAARNVVAAGGVEKMLVQPVSISYPRLHGMPTGRRQRARITWIGDTDLGPHLKGLMRNGGLDAVVRFGEPVEFTGSSDRKEVTRQAEQRVRELLAQDLRDTAA